MSSNQRLDPSLLMDNAACASQCPELLDDHPTRQAILLNVYRPLWDEIERLTRELKVEKATNELAYIPHRLLVESRDKAVAKRDRLRAALIRIRKFIRDANCGTTHWAGCEVGHHDLCAIDRVASKALSRPSPLCAVCDHIEALHKQADKASHAFVPKGPADETTPDSFAGDPGKWYSKWPREAPHCPSCSCGASETKASLTDAQCDDVIEFLADYEWSGLTRENVRTWDDAIASARTTP